MLDRTYRRGGAPVVQGLARNLAGLALLVTASSAPAVVIDSIGVKTTYGYGFLGAAVVADDLPALTVRDGSSVGGIPSEFGLDFTTSASADSFFFMHNQYCVGRCTVYSLTEVTITVRNDGDTGPLRFDSQITAGHLARFGIHDGSSANFDFSVTQQVGTAAARTLYSAEGLADYQQTYIHTSDGIDFNGLNRSSNGNAWEVLDWSATNLNLLLDPIPIGGIATLVYKSTTFTTTGFSATVPPCPDLANCYAVQVAFGDPRNNGGGTTLRDGNLLAELDSDASLSPVIGGLYDAAPLRVAVVDAMTTPLPPNSMPLPRVTYGAPFTSQVAPVPEPASWAMMIAGFAMIGWRCRRRDAMACAA